MAAANKVTTTSNDDAKLFDSFVRGSTRRITDPGAPLDEDRLIAATVDPTDVSRLAFSDVTLVKEAKVPLDHRTAQRLLNFTAVPGERRQDKRHINNLATAMTNTTFVGETTHLAVAKCLENGLVYRVNGQHTSQARLSLPEDMKSPMVNLNLYQAKTLAAVRALYGTYDRGRARSNRNVIDSYLAGTPAFEGIASKTIAFVAAGLSLYLWQSHHERGRHNVDALTALILGEHQEAVKHVVSFFHGLTQTQTNHIARSSVTGAMFGTYYVAPAASLDFWVSVRDGVALDKIDDPRLLLRNDLMRVKVSRNHDSVKRSNSVTLSTEAIFRTCVYAWNEWRAGNSITRLSTGSRSATVRPKFK